MDRHPQGTSEEEQKGAMIAAEREALERLQRICPPDVKPILIADRGFGHAPWLGEIKNRRWASCSASHIHQVHVEQHMGSHKELGIRRSRCPRDWGRGTIDEQEFGPVRVVTVFAREAQEAWYLVTNLEVEQRPR